MPQYSQTIFLDPNQIQINRESRQRRDLDVSDLLDSIKKFGIMNPIIIKREELKNPLTQGITYYIDTLIAGERRLEACKQLNLKVPCRFLSDLTQVEQKVLEFEENHKRKSLPWLEEVRAIGDIHSSYLKSETTWTQYQTAHLLSISEARLSQILNIYNNLNLPILKHAENLSQAISLLTKFQKTTETVIPKEIKSILKPNFQSKFAPVFLPNMNFTTQDEEIEIEKAPPILNLDFTKWIQTYSGPKFNLIHCDFGDLDFWPLTNSFFGNLYSLLDESAHIIFWLDLKYLSETIDYLNEFPSLSFITSPLIWHKSDTKPNHITNSPPLNTYDTALIILHNKRPFLKQIQNLYTSPRAAQPICKNQKSQPMLKYFFQSFIDKETNLLDPTCGSATALCAAEELKAKSVLGLEIDKSRFEKASAKLSRQREIEKLTRR